MTHQRIPFKIGNSLKLNVIPKKKKIKTHQKVKQPAGSLGKIYEEKDVAGLVAVVVVEVVPWFLRSLYCSQ